MKITKKSTTYDIEHEGRQIWCHVSHQHNNTTFEETTLVALPSGKTVNDRAEIHRVDRCVSESDIERVLAEALS